MRGGLSTDFLHSYVYAIIIILAAIGTLYWVGVFDRDNCVINGGFDCKQLKIQPNGVSFSLINRHDTTIDSMQINLSNCGSLSLGALQADEETAALNFNCPIDTEFYGDLTLAYNKSNNTRQTFITYGRIYGTT